MKRLVWNRHFAILSATLLACTVSAQEPRKVCMDVGQFRFRVAGTEVVDKVKNDFGGSINPKEGGKILVVTLSGVAPADCNRFEALAIESFFVVYRLKDRTALQVATAAAFSGHGGQLWSFVPGSLWFDVAKGEATWKVAFAVPAEVTEFWMGLPSTLPTAVKITAANGK